MPTRFTALVGIVLLAATLTIALSLRPMLQGQPAGGAPPSASPAPDSVAVFPFDAPKELHDGVKIHLNAWLREIPTALVADTALRVARPARVQEQARANDYLHSGAQLGVSAILTGQVRAEDDGQRLILEVELLDTRNGLLMWTRTWELDDVFRKNERLPQVRDEIVEGVKKRFEREAALRTARK
ncbi:MAG: hypothetical protein U0840_19590 [Gemmataceae bacterium]